MGGGGKGGVTHYDRWKRCGLLSKCGSTLKNRNDLRMLKVYGHIVDNKKINITRIVGFRV
jgi:hypothetical protein